MKELLDVGAAAVDATSAPIAVDEACPKCGNTDLYVVFHKQGCSDELCLCVNCYYVSHAQEHREHLHVTCRRCQFDWAAPTLEQLQAVAT